ncbi:MAG: phosphotransferase [Eubacteriales bacterium]|nr:phosphotransferase [Eubacteriales bacterium]
MKKDVLSYWDLPETEEQELGTTHTTWLFPGRGVVKKFDSLDKLRRHNVLAEGLAKAGLQAPVVLPGNHAQPYLQCADGYYCLTALVEGAASAKTLLASPDTAAQAAEFGADIALLHRVFQRLQTMDEWPPPSRAMLLPQSEMRKVAELAEVSAQPLTDAVNRLEPLLDRLPVQLIHGDAHPDNRLQKDGALSGWIDFDDVRCDARVVDLCYASCAVVSPLLGAEPSGALALLPGVISGLFLGYDQALRLTHEEKLAVPDLLLCQQAGCLHWFLDHDAPDFARAAVTLLKWLVQNHDNLAILLP